MKLIKIFLLLLSTSKADALEEVTDTLFNPEHLEWLPEPIGAPLKAVQGMVNENVAYYQNQWGELVYGMTPDRCLEPVLNLKSKPQDYVAVEELGQKFINDRSYGRNDLMAWLGVQDLDVEWCFLLGRGEAW